MRNTWVALVLVGLVGCGSDGKDKGNTDANVNNGPDAFEFRDAPSTQTVMVTISGQVTERNQSGATPVSGVSIKAFRNSDETTPIAMTTSDAQGNYSITAMTNGESIDGYLQATKQGYLDTYLYPPYPLMMDYMNAPVIMLTQQTLDTLSTFASGGQMLPGSGKGFIALVVTDGTNPVGGAMVTSSPAASVVRYNGLVGNVVLPSATATMTYTDGIAYLFNETPGQVTVSATGPMTFASHPVKVREDVLTLTVIVP